VLLEAAGARFEDNLLDLFPCDEVIVGPHLGGYAPLIDRGQPQGQALQVQAEVVVGLAVRPSRRLLAYDCPALRRQLLLARRGRPPC